VTGTQGFLGTLLKTVVHFMRHLRSIKILCLIYKATERIINVLINQKFSFVRLNIVAVQNNLC